MPRPRFAAGYGQIPEDFYAGLQLYHKRQPLPVSELAVTERKRNRLRLLVYGSLYYRDRATVFASLDLIHARRVIGCLITGWTSEETYRGVNRFAADWAELRHVKLLRFRPEYGTGPERSTGPIWTKHKHQLFEEGKPQALLLFPGSNARKLKATANRLGILCVEHVDIPDEP